MTTTTTPATTTASFQTVKVLRQTGDLRAAYNMARQLVEADPDNLWNRRALAWVYADRLKDAAAQPNSATRLIRGLQTATELAMPAEETIWREQVLWCVVKYMLRTAPENLPLVDLAGLVSLSRAFVPDAPCLVRSVWFRALLKHNKTENQGSQLDWLGLLDQFGWDGFRPEDYQPDAAPANPVAVGPTRTGGALVERVCLATARQLLQTVPVFEAEVRPLAERLAALSNQYPDWTFVPYYRAKLLLTIGDRPEALRVFLPFARQKNGNGPANSFWVWSMLADLVEDDPTKPDLALSCLFRAVLPGTPETFLVKVRQQLAGRLIGQGRWAEARFQVEKLMKTRQQEGWKIPDAVNNWLNDNRYTSVKAMAPAAHEADAASAILWGDLPEAIAVVVSVDTTKQRAVLALDARTTVLLSYARFGGLNPSVGDALTIRYEPGVATPNEATKPPKLRVLRAEPTTQPLPNGLITLVTGPLRTVAGKAFGFVGHVLVPAEVLLAHSGLVDALVEVRAYAAWDERKNKSGWRGFSIEKKVVNLLKDRE